MTALVLDDFDREGAQVRPGANLHDLSARAIQQQIVEIARVIFSGARTVAHLLSRQTEETDATEWLAQALCESAPPALARFRADRPTLGARLR